MKNLLFLTFIILSSFIFTDDIDSTNASKPIVKESTDTQDLNIPTKLCQEKDFCFYIEGDVGYRYDKVKNSLHLTSSWYDITGSRDQSSKFCQFNGKLGAKIWKYFFLNGAVGYGLLGSNDENESSFLTGTNVLVNAYSKSFSSGFGFDWLVEGGLFLPLYKKRIAFLPEIGYGSKRYYIKNSLDLKISSPYVGGKLYFALGANIGLGIYGNYFFAPTRKEKGSLYLVSSNSFFPTHDIKNHHDIPTYNIGANLSYLITHHMSISANWERFATSAGIKTITPIASGVASQLTLNEWTSNQFTLGFRYSF